MKLSNAMKLGFGAAAGAMLACATPAMALDRGCQDADTVRAALRDEGQYVLVTGEAANDVRSRAIFTSNENGELGYNIEQGSGSLSGQLCVIAKYTDVRVNTNLDSTTPPTWARFGSGTANDRFFESAVRNNDARVLLGARILVPQAGGSEVQGAFMTVSKGNGFGAVMLTQNDGAISPITALANLSPQQPNYANFQGRTSTVAIASLSYSGSK